MFGAVPSRGDEALAAVASSPSTLYSWTGRFVDGAPWTGRFVDGALPPSSWFRALGVPTALDVSLVFATDAGVDTGAAGDAGAVGDVSSVGDVDKGAGVEAEVGAEVGVGAIAGAGAGSAPSAKVVMPLWAVPDIALGGEASAATTEGDMAGADPGIEAAPDAGARTVPGAEAEGETVNADGRPSAAAPDWLGGFVAGRAGLGSLVPPGTSSEGYSGSERLRPNDSRPPAREVAVVVTAFALSPAAAGVPAVAELNSPACAHSCECALAPLPDRGLLLRWPSAVAVRAQ
jgi:hypothetical protein